MKYAPIALFVYNRPWHTRQTVEALKKNELSTESELYIFSDAPRSESANDAVGEVRAYIRNITVFKSITIIERETNYGLARSIIEGVTRLCNEFGRVIVLEDDLVTSPYFLRYMNDALKIYENVNQVASVSGYMYPIKLPIEDQFFFWTIPQSWGWAAWQRSWKYFNENGKDLYKNIMRAGLSRIFNKRGPQPFIKMLKDQIEGKNSSWYIRWYASTFLEKKLTLMPATSLVKNIGIDGTGEHCSNWKFDPFMTNVAEKPVNVKLVKIEKNQKITLKMEKYFRKVKILRYVNYIFRVLSNTKKIFMKKGFV